MTRHVFTLIWNRKRTNLLIIAEIFVSFLVLFAVAGLGVYTLDNWWRPLGFSYDRVWNISIDMNQTSDDEFVPAQQETTRQLLLALGDFPEVEASAGTMLAPYQFGSSSSIHEWRGRRVEFGTAEVTDGFKDLLGLTVVEGRWFGPEDTGQQYEPVVINQDMRRDLFGDGPAIGMTLTPERTADAGPPRRESRIVGVVAAYREDGEFDGTRNYAIYRKDMENPEGIRNRPPRNLLIKVAPGTTAAFEERLVSQLQSVAPEWSFEITPLAEMRASSLRFSIAPLVAIGLVAGFLMLMVALGLLGVLWQNVTERTQEVGLRRAKGATRVNVQRQILGEVGVITTLAVALGTAIAVQFPLLDIIYFVELHVYAVALVLSAGAIYALTLACAWYPSRMATRVEPAEALRYE
jgi:putative ABC transport system permease protein